MREKKNETIHEEVLSTTGEIADGQMLEALRNIGYSIDDETIYLGKLRLIQEAPYPAQ